MTAGPVGQASRPATFAEFEGPAPLGRQRLVTAAAASVALGFVAVLVWWPVAAVVVRAGADFGSVFGRAATWSVVGFTVAQAIVSALAALLVGLPIASTLARYDFWGRGLLRAAVTVPFVLPTLVVAGAVREVLGTGVVPIVVAHMVLNVAVVVRVVGARWAVVEASGVAEAAATLGLGPLARWRRVTGPLIAPAVAAATVVVLLFCLTSFGTVLVLGGGRRATIETEVYRYAVTRGELDVASALAIVQVALVAVVALVSRRSVATGVTLRVRRPVRRPVGAAWFEVVGAGLLAGVVVLGPLVWWAGSSVGPASLGALADRVPLVPVTPLAAMVTSLWIAAVAGVVAGFVGIAAVVLSRSAWGPVAVVSVLAPLAVPAVVLGFGYLLAFGSFRGSVWLIPLAHAAVGLPLVWSAVAPAVDGFDRRLTEAAATLGASPGRRLVRVVAPLLAPAVVAGIGLAAVVSLGEFGATAFLVRGAHGFTAPMAIFRLLSQPGDQLHALAAALGLVLSVVVTLVVALVDRLDRTTSS